MFKNKPLLAYEEWNINFSELTVGASIGSGKNGFIIKTCEVFSNSIYLVVLAIDLQQE